MPLPLRHLQVVTQLPPEGTPMPCFTSDIRSPAICIMGMRFNAKQVPAANPGMSALVTDTNNGTPSTCLTPAQVQVTLTTCFIADSSGPFSLVDVASCVLCRHVTAGNVARFWHIHVVLGVGSRTARWRCTTCVTIRGDCQLSFRQTHFSLQLGVARSQSCFWLCRFSLASSNRVRFGYARPSISWKSIRCKSLSNTCHHRKPLGWDHSCTSVLGSCGVSFKHLMRSPSIKYDERPHPGLPFHGHLSGVSMDYTGLCHGWRPQGWRHVPVVCHQEKCRCCIRCGTEVYHGESMCCTQIRMRDRPTRGVFLPRWLQFRRDVAFPWSRPIWYSRHRLSHRHIRSERHIVRPWGLGYPPVAQYFMRTEHTEPFHMPITHLHILARARPGPKSGRQPASDPKCRTCYRLAGVRVAEGAGTSAGAVCQAPVFVSAAKHSGGRRTADAPRQRYPAQTFLTSHFSESFLTGSYTLHTPNGVGCNIMAFPVFLKFLV